MPLDGAVRVSPQLARDLHGGAHDVGELRHVAAVADVCLPVFPKQGFWKQGFSESWKCALGSCENLCLGITKPGFSHPGQTFIRSRENPCFQNPCLWNPRRGCQTREVTGGQGGASRDCSEREGIKRFVLGCAWSHSKIPSTESHGLGRRL